MARFAYFDSAAPSPARVLGWYDTDEFVYATLPAASDLLAVTDAEWSARVTDPSGWAVQSGALVAYVPPVVPPTLAQQAAALLATGLAITSTATAALDATYPANMTAQAQINAEVTSILLNGTFADGTSTIEWLDVTGAAHAFTVAQFKTLATAIGAFVSGCIKCMNGQATTPPSATATIP